MDLYNYWLMEKVAEEEKQESFAKRHKKKLIGGGSLVGSGLVGTYAGGRVVARESNILRKEHNRAKNDLLKNIINTIGKIHPNLRRKLKADANYLRELRETQKRRGEDPMGGRAGEVHANLKDSGKRYGESRRLEKKIELLKKQRNDTATAFSDFDKRNVLGKVWQGGKRLVKDVGSKFLKRGK